MATKRYELEHGVISKAHDDEPLFILRAQDMLAIPIIELWIASARAANVSEQKLIEVEALVLAMKNWDGQKKIPD